jgi:hypothetical protein
MTKKVCLDALLSISAREGVGLNVLLPLKKVGFFLPSREGGGVINSQTFETQNHKNDKHDSSEHPGMLIPSIDYDISKIIIENYYLHFLYEFDKKVEPLTQMV